MYKIITYTDGRFIAYRGLKYYYFTPEEIHDLIVVGNTVMYLDTIDIYSLQLLTDNIYDCVIHLDKMKVLFAPVTVARGQLSFTDYSEIFGSNSLLELIQYTKQNKLKFRKVE